MKLKFSLEASWWKSMEYLETWNIYYAPHCRTKRMKLWNRRKTVEHIWGIFHIALLKVSLVFLGTFQCAKFPKIQFQNDAPTAFIRRCSNFIANIGIHVRILATELLDDFLTILKIMYLFCLTQDSMGQQTSKGYFSHSFLPFSLGLFGWILGVTYSASAQY